ncbi:Uncharacterized protein FWK35_00017736 [Aphis craccivora]|uniref:Uncharacterized protein n=1 Tax=Aphis craccivora TaxID=307492 RepID=A0A6G0ZJ98_APHCR|nr:Uncharacterized protein FWK35_00017736 [Aphis craccivora]
MLWCNKTIFEQTPITNCLAILAMAPNGISRHGLYWRTEPNGRHREQEPDESLSYTGQVNAVVHGSRGNRV